MISLAQVRGPLAVCTQTGELIATTPSARHLLRQRGVDIGAIPARLPTGLWHDLTDALLGEAIEWHVDQVDDLGCTRYPLGEDRYLLLMKELGARDRSLAIRLHRQRLQATGQLMASIAHDLRTALASVMLETDLLIATGLADRNSSMEALERVRSSSYRLRSTIDGLLEFSRGGGTEASDCHVGEVLSRVAGLVRPRLREDDVSLVITVEHRDTRVPASALVVEQILVNLVMNAADASPPHGTIQVASATVTDPDGARRVEITVLDQGAGVDPAMREHIFDPFFTTKPAGTGLGLASARTAARGLGGELRLVPSAAGARFSLSLPVKP